MSLKVDFIVYFVSCQFHTSYALLVNSMIMMMMKINIIVAIDMTSAMTAASYCVTQGSIWALCSSREWLKFVLAKTHFGRILCTIFFSAIVSEIGQNTLIVKIKTLQYSQHLLFHHQLLKLEFLQHYLPKIYAQYRRQSEFLTITRSETTNNNWTTNILPKQLCIVI